MTRESESATWTSVQESFGDLEPTPRVLRFFAKVDVLPSGCWEWTAYRVKDGYGRICWTEGNFLCHRVTYEWANGKIPDGLEIDHLCRNRACVNPSHLEAVEHQENCKRGDYAIQGQRARERWLSKTHCPQGHPYSGDNLYIRPSNAGRGCKACTNEAGRRYYAKTKGHRAG